MELTNHRTNSGHLYQNVFLRICLWITWWWKVLKRIHQYEIFTFAYNTYMISSLPLTKAHHICAVRGLSVPLAWTKHKDEVYQDWIQYCWHSLAEEPERQKWTISYRSLGNKNQQNLECTKLFQIIITERANSITAICMPRQIPK